MLKGQPPPAADLDGACEITRSLPHGHVAAVLGMARQLGLEELIDPVPSRSRHLVTAMAVAQVIAPDSKLAIARGLREETAASSLGEVLHLGSCDEDDLYAAMDYLAVRQQRIQDALAARHLAGGTLVLYDVSSAASGGRTCPLGAIGHPKDGVRGGLQIVYGLLTSKDPRAAPVRAYLAAVPALPGRDDPGAAFFTAGLPDGAQACVLAVIEHATRRIRILGVTQHPAGDSTAQQARNLMMDPGEQAHRARFMTRDRGPDFTAAFDAVLAGAGIRTVLCNVRTSRMNAIAERWTGGWRRELLDRALIWNRGHLRRILREYETHHDRHRPHRALNALPR